MIGLIRVFTAEDPNIIAEHGNIVSKLYGIPVISRCIPDQPKGIYDEETEAIAVPKIVELGKAMEQEGCKVLLISCAADPGLELLRRNVSIPVIGAGSAAALIALAAGERVGAMGITESIPPAVGRVLGDLLVGYIQPEGVTNTTDLLTESGRTQALEAARSLVSQGSKAIVFACTGFSTIGFADVLRKELQVPVIDAVEAEGLFASSLYRWQSPESTDLLRD
ncbi:hydantoin racemase [Paenibacillus sp. H1-7]|uniref:aspartate/glutamate racemase family protein n=1 Tax=Paenibacillus sp. H1-7 TaxID=2282849 RepID=UPI001EF7C56D|nr:aspartate/glutamate racemase family protein [Paenibacillus sp. H1-7]ULL14561.1 hydantoin racemase [Paenibacillus sp. H1-7]